MCVRFASELFSGYNIQLVIFMLIESRWKKLTVSCLANGRRGWNSLKLIKKNTRVVSGYTTCGVFQIKTFKY